jgi:hypothetical protein
MNTRNAILTLGLAVVATAAQADLLYDNGGPDLENGNEMNNWLQTENFVVGTTSTVESIHFWTIENGTWDGTLDWWIFFDNGSGQPGALHSAGAAMNINRVATGNVALGAYTEYEWTFDIDPSVVAGGVPYYLGLRSAGSNGMYWETTNSGNAPFGWESQGGTMNNWFNNGEEHGFQINGTVVPEPATFVAIGGLAALALLRRRR